MEISEGYVHYIWVIKPPFTMPKNPQVTIKMVSCRAPPRRFRRCCFWQRLWASRDRPWPWPRETSLPGEPLRIARSGCDNLTSPERAACLSGEVSGRCDLKWFGMNRNDPEWFGSIWNHLEWFGEVTVDMNGPGLNLGGTAPQKAIRRKPREVWPGCGTMMGLYQ